MWFIFPQHRGLGRTSNSQFYGIESSAEALAYLRHPVLGPRLLECTQLVLAAPQGLAARDILGARDDQKLRSCMTLFAAVAPEEAVFRDVLERFYGGEPDAATVALLRLGGKSA